MDNTLHFNPDRYIANYTEFNFHVSIYLYFNKNIPFSTKYIEANKWVSFKIPTLPIVTGIEFKSVTNALQLRYFARSIGSKNLMSIFEKPSIHLHQGRDVEFYFYLTSYVPEEQS
ncbi:hypothetical protein [Xenorhabdus budapestensis]|uniref:Uncharacterized protein n=1 Tax=Xenorhabdus budapestensis TaxID=290110 RepID=A0A2D0J0L7_XENBU|nr:hypothetical protein [Xenorhabdus budapestensis]PHM27756.1 hypothetical protein Xbud_02065 [Xenorhabdus budapestensis]